VVRGEEGVSAQQKGGGFDNPFPQKLVVMVRKRLVIGSTQGEKDPV